MSTTSRNGADKTRPQYHDAPRSKPFPDPKYLGANVIEMPSGARYHVRQDGWRRAKATT